MRTQLGTPYEQGRNGMKEDIIAKIQQTYHIRFNEAPPTVDILEILELIKTIK